MADDSSLNPNEDMGNGIYGIYVVAGALVVAVLVAGFLMFAGPPQTHQTAIAGGKALIHHLALNGWTEKSCVRGDEQVSSLKARLGDRIIVVTQTDAVGGHCPTPLDILVLYPK